MKIYPSTNSISGRFMACLLWAGVVLTVGTAPAAAEPLTKVELGEMLFFDPNLSNNRTQACASCHDPEAGFIDPRDNAAKGAVSLGDDGKSLGDRNTPTASYARFSPPFGKNAEGIFLGGLFLDGRAASLADQAGGPPLNPIEMAMPDKATVVARLQENEVYVEGMQAQFGADIFDDTDNAYTAMSEAIAAFENTAFFAPFDSKYDRYLKGEYTLSPTEELGMTLFFSNQFTNCNRCHQLRSLPEAAAETFTNYQYHNIGVPENAAARAVNGVAADFVDDGLLAHPDVQDPAQRGKFKTPTLRNVAVTGPYMHNGVFRDLTTVVRFYNKYNGKAPATQINPETGQTWAPPEVPENISTTDLEVGDALDDRRINALVAFLKLLTDQRYEHLLAE
ncbi:MAG: cytochrome-c peroxidase [Magnetospiraceae bacterium]